MKWVYQYQQVNIDVYRIYGSMLLLLIQYLI